MALFEAQAERAFEQDIMALLRTQYPEALGGLPGALLRQRVQRALYQGRTHGFTWQSALTGFTMMMFELGPNFDQHPAFHSALRIPHPDEDERLRLICLAVDDQAWREAQAFADPSAWHDTGASRCTT